MTPERWTRIEELFHTARALPPRDRAAFLDQACADDISIRRNVESLLDDSASDDGFLASPALGFAAQLVADPVLATRVGACLGVYQLQALIGAGGMGEVYRARDTRLERDVAIKILPEAFTSNQDRLARFEREARTLAALNHPNICAIHGLDEADGLRFLVLELVEGDTLAASVAQTRDSQGKAVGLPLGRALTIARQIADALEFAHERGIVHRDLKPANINITADGFVKVLDFGLAKVVKGDGFDSDGVTERVTGETHVGAVMGTAAYMSPEQARGLPVDKRTDIWGFGCVLYEMLTGRTPFAGDTASDSIARILEREPDWSRLPAATPAPIQRLLLRCLTKDPKRRLRDIGDVRIELDAIADALPGSTALVVPPESVRSRTTWLPWAALAAVAMAWAAWEALRPAAPPPDRFSASTIGDNPLATATFSRLTNWAGTEEHAEISPDGGFVAFLADKAGQLDVWVSQVGTGAFENLTADIPPLLTPGNLLRSLGFRATARRSGSVGTETPPDRKCSCR